MRLRTPHSARTSLRAVFVMDAQFECLDKDMTYLLALRAFHKFNMIYGFLIAALIVSLHELLLFSKARFHLLYCGE